MCGERGGKVLQGDWQVQSDENQGLQAYSISPEAYAMREDRSEEDDARLGLDKHVDYLALYQQRGAVILLGERIQMVDVLQYETVPEIQHR